MFSFIPSWVRVSALVLTGVAMGATVQGWRMGSEAADLKPAFSAYKEKASHDALESSLKLRQAERDLVRKLADKDDETKRKIDAVAVERDAALRELRKRSTRRANAVTKHSAAVGQCSGASGAELSREDAEFLTGEAARADRCAVRLNGLIGRFGVDYGGSCLVPEN